MSTPTAYHNGQFVPMGKVSISLSDPGFVWGAVATDRIRTFGRKLFRLDEHLRRFRQSCDMARVEQLISDRELASNSELLAAENRASDDLQIIWLATPGPTLIGYTQPLDRQRAAKLQRDGARLISTAASLGTDPLIKHRSRLAWWIAQQDVRSRDPDAEPLFVTPDTGHILETPTANVLAVIAGIVTSPPAGTILDGVSLGVVRELCQAHAIPFAERPITLTELEKASEVLLTNSSYCVAGVSSIDSRPVPFPGPILNRLLDAWTELVGVDVRPPAES